VRRDDPILQWIQVTAATAFDVGHVHAINDRTECGVGQLPSVRGRKKRDWSLQGVAYSSATRSSPQRAARRAPSLASCAQPGASSEAAACRFRSRWPRGLRCWRAAVRIANSSARPRSPHAFEARHVMRQCGYKAGLHVCATFCTSAAGRQLVSEIALPAGGVVALPVAGAPSP